MFWPIFEALTKELESHGDLNRWQEDLEERVRSQFGLQPPVNVYGNDAQVVVTAELPGVAAEDIHIGVENRVLTLDGERKAPELGEEDAYLKQERSHGKFERKVRLPFDVDVDKIVARQVQGVLTVTLPRAESSKPHNINVESD